MTIASVADFPSEYSRFRIVAFLNTKDDKDHIAIVKGDIGEGEDVLVRVLYAAGSGPGDGADEGHGGLEARRAVLEAAGCVCLEAGRGRRVELGLAFASLARRGVRSLMVEGGGLVLRSFVESGYADRYLLTIAPVLALGYNPFSSAVDAPRTPAGGSFSATPLRYLASLRYGADLVVAAEPA